MRGVKVGQAFQPDSARSDPRPVRRVLSELRIAARAGAAVLGEHPTRRSGPIRPDPRQAGKPDLRRAGLLLLALAIPAAARGDDAPMTISGRVLDPAGKPVPDAAVMVLVRSKLADRPTLTPLIRPTTAHEGRCDGSGRFRVEVPRTSSARHDGLVVTARRPPSAWAGPSSIPTPTRPPPMSRCGPSRSSGAGCSTCRAGRRGGSPSRSTRSCRPGASR